MLAGKRMSKQCTHQGTHEQTDDRHTAVLPFLRSEDILEFVSRAATLIALLHPHLAQVNSCSVQYVKWARNPETTRIS